MPVAGTNTKWQDGTIDMGTLKIGAVAVTATPAELNIMDGVTAITAELNYLDIATLGTGAASKAMVLNSSKNYTYPSGGTLTLASINVMSGLTSLDGNILETEGGVGIVGIAETYKTAVYRVGGVIKTEILIDISGLRSSGSDDDVIGDEGTGAAHLGRITTARNGLIWKGRMSCLELPGAGNPAVALWSATENTGVEDTLITALTQTELLQSQGDGTDWIDGDETRIPTMPAAGQYLYLVCGDSSGPDADYTAGRFLIEFWGV